MLLRVSKTRPNAREKINIEISEAYFRLKIAIKTDALYFPTTSLNSASVAKLIRLRLLKCLIRSVFVFSPIPGIESVQMQFGSYSFSR
jgi:hypothetical protein